MFFNRVNLGKHYYWKPWLGCKKVSEACEYCFIQHHNEFILNDYDNIPFKDIIKPGSVVVTSLSTDFFLEEADEYRSVAWNTIKENSDLVFLLITKRLERVIECLPEDWEDGYENVVICVTVENQYRADERIPLLKKIPAKHKWITCSPLLEEINIQKYLNEGFIEHVECCGEKGDWNVIRELKYEWVKNLSEQCKKSNVRFSFMQIGHKFVYKDKIYSERCTCYTSQLATILELDHYEPLVFNLKSLQKTF